MAHPSVFPTLTYDDAQAAIDFLVEAFGAERHAVYSAEDGTIQHAELRFGNGMVMLGTSSSDRPAADGGIYIVVEDPDAHCARARAAGAEITRELRDEPYGSREYTAKDPEGKTWYFGTYQPFAHDQEAEQAKAGSAG